MATRGVPRARRASARAPSGEIGTSSTVAERRTISSIACVAIEVQPQHRPESIPQRSGQQRQPSRSADQRESGQVDPHRPRRRSLAEDDVDGEVFHCGIEHFLNRAVEPVDLVDEQNVARLEIRQDRNQIALTLDRRARGDAQADAHLGRDDRRQRRLAESRRPVKQDVVERFAALFRRIDEDLERLFDAFLPDVLGKPSRAQAALHGHILDELPRRHGAIGRLRKLGATANGGTCFSDHAVSIAEELELLFAFLRVGEHAWECRLALGSGDRNARRPARFPPNLRPGPLDTPAN